MAASSCFRCAVGAAKVPSSTFVSPARDSASSFQLSVFLRCKSSLRHGHPQLPGVGGSSGRGFQLRINAINIGDFGARDPFPAEIESNFGDKVIGFAGTEHVILIPPSKLGLSERSCRPIEPGTQALTEDEAKALLRKVIGWRLVQADKTLKIFCEWNMKDFGSGVILLDRIAVVASAEEHYPELHLTKDNKVRAELSTQAIGGLSENDFILAAKIDNIQTSDLVKKTRFWA